MDVGHGNGSPDSCCSWWERLQGCEGRQGRAGSAEGGRLLVGWLLESPLGLLQHRTWGAAQCKMKNAKWPHLRCCKIERAQPKAPKMRLPRRWTLGKTKQTQVVGYMYHDLTSMYRFSSVGRVGIGIREGVKNHFTESVRKGGTPPRGPPLQN